MAMFFNTDMNYFLLFSPFLIDTCGKAVAACIGSFFLAIIYESLIAFRHHLLLKQSCNMKCTHPLMNGAISQGGLHQTKCPACPGTNERTSNSSLVPSESGEQLHVRSVTHLRGTIHSFFNCYHVVQTFLHLIHSFLGYMLMLIVMTYNVYILIAILLGFTVGYFLFATKRALLLRTQSCCD